MKVKLEQVVRRARGGEETWDQTRCVARTVEKLGFIFPATRRQTTPF